ncbi:hypothetical protein [Citrobacter amalonaticus]|uniref:hypothetical protein n=1 Tax=Citrobacter amalonaticus TaxID=35703 RepID=UPI001905E409|nr:hypothetical protein [Citrobacter amalonaticus]MBJ8735850.1 hypothetical protein [Citrobacter amalonaticus]
MSKIDIWSARAANFSQIGVLALAAFGYFYTVLPVYQKSLLDEEIAKKTLELEKKDKQISEFNKILAERGAELKKLSDDASKAKAEANYAKQNLKTMQGKYSKQYSELRIHLFSQFMSLARQQCSDGKMEKNKITECFNNIANSADLKELNALDMTKLKRSIQIETPKLMNNYYKRKQQFDTSMQSIKSEIIAIETECQNNRTKKDYEDSIKKITIDYECNMKKSKSDTKKYKLEIDFLFGKEEILSKSLENIANMAVN